MVDQENTDCDQGFQILFTLFSFCFALTKDEKKSIEFPGFTQHKCPLPVNDIIQVGDS